MRRLLGIWLFVFLLAPALCRAAVRGRVLDPAGAVIPGARVSLYGPHQSLAGSMRADAEGRFSFASLSPGDYELVVEFPDMDPVSRAVSVRSGPPPAELEIVLQLGGVSTTVTVTPARGEVQDAFAHPAAVNVVTREEISRRPMVILPQALREEAGIQVQQTSAHQGAVLVRGLTGQQVLHLFDGVRFNNSTFRPGPNQYLASIDPSGIERARFGPVRQ